MKRVFLALCALLMAHAALGQPGAKVKSLAWAQLIDSEGKKSAIDSDWRKAQ